jgi:hypothetical protein
VGSSDHHLPVAGGVLDQSAWWMELKTLLKTEENRIVEDQQKRNE